MCNFLKIIFYTLRTASVSNGSTYLPNLTKAYYKLEANSSDHFDHITSVDPSIVISLMVIQSDNGFIHVLYKFSF